MKTLDEIAFEHKTDRATVFTRTPGGKPHGYAPHYDQIFKSIRLDPVKLLEIGVASGEGIKMWLEYFPMGDIFGVDIVHDTNVWNTPGAKDTPGNKSRYTFETGDQGSVEFWRKFVVEHGKFDIIVDDGSHINTDVIVSFAELWSHVNPGGFYCIEDMATAYDPAFVKSNFPDHVTWFKGRIDDMNLGNEIDWMRFSEELCIIRKKL